MLTSLNCPNLVEVSTRFGNSSNTILDHIITNVEESKIEYGVLDFAITDHLPIFAVLKHKVASPENKSEQTGQMWQKLDESKKDDFLRLLEEKLSCINLGNEPNELLQNLTSATKNTIDTCFPPQQLSKKAKKRAEQPWIDGEILKQEREQAKLFRKSNSTGNAQDLKNYNIFRRKLHKKKKGEKKRTSGNY